MVHDILDLIKRGFPGATAATILLFIVWYLVMPVISIHLTLMKFLSAALAICLILSFIIALLGAFLELFDRFLQIIHRHDHHKVDIERKKAELEVRATPGQMAENYYYGGNSSSFNRRRPARRKLIHSSLARSGAIAMVPAVGGDSGQQPVWSRYESSRIFEQPV